MKNQEPNDITFKKVAWTIKNFSTLKTSDAHFSEVFTAAGCACHHIFGPNYRNSFVDYKQGPIIRTEDVRRKLRVYRGSRHGQYLGVYLEVADVSSFPQGWSVNAAYKLTVVNQFFTKDSVTKGDINYMFSTYGIGYGYSSFMELTELQKPYNGYIWNDTCIVEVEFSQVSYEGPQIERALGEKDEDLVKFKDLGLIEKALVPLLEEACLWHPSLMDCKQKGSPKFTEWAFTALGRVLQFLKNKKWKDMNEKACEELQQLWGELAMSGLDLSWLEPLVKSAINMKGYADKVEKIKKLKLELMISEMGVNIIKKKIGDTEQSVEKIRKELVNAMEDFEEKDLDAEIGYGKA